MRKVRDREMFIYMVVPSVANFFSFEFKSGWKGLKHNNGERALDLIPPNLSIEIVS